MRHIAPIRHAIYPFVPRLLTSLLIVASLPCLGGERVIDIVGQKTITEPTVYSHAIIHLHNGSLLVTHQATLTITDSTIDGTVSPENPRLFSILSGSLTLRNNTVTIQAKNITPKPESPPTYNTLTLLSGHITLIKNQFSVDKPFSVGLLTTGALPTSGMTIVGNQIYQFHGGILAQNTNNNFIINNTFSNVSCGNIYFKNSQHITINGNTIHFSGNNNVGDSVDLIDSNDIKINGNNIYASSCYSIFIMRSQNVSIQQNGISGGITYAVYATASLGPENPNRNYIQKMEHQLKETSTTLTNKNIRVINNYFAQNRFGFAANTVSGLTVTDNLFIQRFKNPKNRQFWTNNNVLLNHIDALHWERNRYKEAFSQDIFDDNSKSHILATFPAADGVTLS